MIKAKAIIFDMDGVLVPTPKYVWKTHNKLLSEYGKHVGDDEIHTYLGMGLGDQIKLFEKDFNIKIDHRKFSSKFTEEFNKLFQAKKSAVLENLFNFIKENNQKIAVATSSSKERADKVLSDLGITQYCDALIYRDDVKLGKPNPEIYLMTAKKLGVKPEECIVVEDAVKGIKAAKSANMKVIALATKLVKRSELKIADYVVDSLEEIKTIIKENIQ